MATEGNIRDVLIAEMLGDVGLLHDKVESLKQVLPGQIEEVEQKIVGLIGLLSKAGDAYQEKIKKYTDAEVAKALALIEKAKVETKTQLDRDRNDAVRATLAEVQQAVESIMRREVSSPVRAALRSPLRTFWPILIAGLFCGIFGSIICIGYTRLVIDKEERNYAAWGKALSNSWGKLDAKTKAAISANPQ